jgi:hypothetical protein
LNIQNDFHKRLRWIINTTNKLSPFKLKGGVQPTIDYHHIMKRMINQSFSVAGNVGYTLSPGKGKKYTIEYAFLSCSNDNDAGGDAYIRLKIEDKDSNDLTSNIFGSAIADNASGYLTISKHAVQAGCAYQYDDIGFPNGLPIWEEDFYNFSVSNGKAADVLAGRLRITEEDIPLEN